MEITSEFYDYMNKLKQFNQNIKIDFFINKYQALQNYKKQVKGTIEKLPGDLAHLSDEKIFFLSFANVNLI